MAEYSRWLPQAIVLTEAVAVLCQFIQDTDPRFPLVYFTVLSGVIVGLVAVVAISIRGHSAIVERARITATVGVVVSAIIFATVIAPASSTGTWFQPWDDAWVRAATVLFHAVAPVLVVADLVLRRSGLSRGEWVLAAYIWPLSYLMLIAVAGTAFGLPIPYPFLSPAQMGWGIFVLALSSLALSVGLVALLLYWAAAVRSRRHS